MAGMLPGRTAGARCVSWDIWSREPHAPRRVSGFGQTQAALVRERSVDLVAAALGRDPVDLRLQNMLGPDELPHTTSMFLTYDNGDYPAALRRARELAASWPSPEADGRRRGVGYAPGRAAGRAGEQQRQRGDRVDDRRIRDVDGRDAPRRQRAG